MLECFSLFHSILLNDAPVVLKKEVMFRRALENELLIYYVICSR